MTLSSLTCIFDGGKNHLATAGGKDTANIPAALSKVEEIVEQYL